MSVVRRDLSHVGFALTVTGTLVAALGLGGGFAGVLSGRTDLVAFGYWTLQCGLVGMGVGVVLFLIEAWRRL